MPQGAIAVISWNEFEQLPGSQQHNFEMLCRALIWLRHGKHGHFVALANQVGVEFHLQLHTACALGQDGYWLGWQCRWYDLPSGRALGAARRKKIQEALDKTHRELPGLTDWVLWTRRPLTKGDRAWFDKLSTGMRLQSWTAVEAEAMLSGDAEILRRTYFGELRLTPEILRSQHELSVARIRKRWLPEAHQAVDAERQLRRMLGEVSSWDQLVTVADRLNVELSVIEGDARAIAGPLADTTPPFLNFARTVVSLLRDVHQLLEKGDLTLLRQRLISRPRAVAATEAAAPRRLRGARLPCGLDATNALADCRLGLTLLNNVDECSGQRLIAIIADAGGGKTQLAAQLTAELPMRPAGILLHGLDLHSGRSLDELAGTVSIQGQPVATIESLVAALDAAAQRSHCRLPLVIDGLNEAEDPRQWKPQLAQLDTMLRQYAGVLVVCTLRTGARQPTKQNWPGNIPEVPDRSTFADAALPADIIQIEMPDFGGDTSEAIGKYFRYYRIIPGDADLPYELLTHPLTLRIFCEVTNPERKTDVGIEAMPGSLTALFERYLDRACERIAELAPRSHRYCVQDVRRALNVLGQGMWDSHDRELPESEVRRELSDEARPWNESLIHLLEQEGVILRVPGRAGGQQNIIPVYDALGGFLVANTLLGKLGSDGLTPWLRDAQTLLLLNGTGTETHPLAGDVFRALSGLVPRRLHGAQLWQMLEEPLRATALQLAARIESAYLDKATIDALAEFIRSGGPQSGQMFVRLFYIRSATKHPLNSEFLDAILRSMTVSLRDHLWTEWVRRNTTQGVGEDVAALERRWQQRPERIDSDRLRAIWVQWLLTTTIRNLRDRATRALYWFGRGAPQALFDLTENAAGLNDPYIFERLLAASYGAAMALCAGPTSGEFRRTILPALARRLYVLLFAAKAPGRTTHVLTREYARRYLELAAYHAPKLFSVHELKRSRPPYADGGRIIWREAPEDGEEIHGRDSPFRMDFENYTLGRLAEGRGNYDFKHEGYRKIRRQLFWRVRDLGWSVESFGQLDQIIESSRHTYNRVADGAEKVDRYGKKYSWIAYFELQGFLNDQGLLPPREFGVRISDVDLDPSFPAPVAPLPVITADFLGRPTWSLKHWIQRGPVPDLSPYLRLPKLGTEPGPWIALDGFVVQQDEKRGRRLFSFLRSFLVRKEEADDFARLFGRQSMAGRWLSEKPRLFYTFSGEAPWAETYPANQPTIMRLLVSSRTVRVKRKRQELLLDGKPVSLSSMDLWKFRIFRPLVEGAAETRTLTPDELRRVVRRSRLVEVDETQDKSRKFRTLIPVCDFDWEGSDLDDNPVQGTMVARQLAESAKLSLIPQTHDMQDTGGRRASYCTAIEEDYNNTQKFMYLREDVLQTLLRAHGFTLFWAVWGERELSHHQMERARPDGDLAGLSHSDFQTIHRYRGTRLPAS